MSKSTKHWHAMNGSSGCMPDSNTVHSSKESAIESIKDLFGTDGAKFHMAAWLRTTGIYYFSNPREAGADYAEVSECHEADCLIEDKWGRG